MPLQTPEENVDHSSKEETQKQRTDRLFRIPFGRDAAPADAQHADNLRVVPGPDGNAEWKACRDSNLLCTAAQCGRYEVVSALLHAGVKPDLSSRCGQKLRSPLHHAASGGHEAVVKLLLETGADVQCVDRELRSPLYLAVEGGHVAVVQSLLARGASPNSKDCIGESPLHAAARLGREDVVPVLTLAGAQVDIADDSRHSPLHMAALYGQVAATKALLEAGAEIDLLDEHEYSASALSIACSRGHVDVMRALLQHGADVMACYSDGDTALHVAARWNEPRAIDVLVEAGADVDAADISGRAPLFSAAHKGGCDAVVALLRHGANVNCIDKRGCSPLRQACWRLNVQTVQVLLEWGADETIVDSRGRSASEVAGHCLHSSYRHQRAGDIARVRGLLTRASADRAWRRRGLLVLCRALPHRARPSHFSNQAFGRRRPQDGGASCCTILERDAVDEGSSVYKISCYDGGTGGDATSRETERDCHALERIEARLVDLAQDVIFRHIMSFM